MLTRANATARKRAVNRRRRCTAAFLAGAILGLSPSAIGAEPPDAQPAASSPSALEPLVDAFATEVATLDPSSPAQRFEAAAERYGGLVGRARELGAGAELFGRLARAGQDLEGRIDAARARREDQADEEEAALEALYRSQAWQRLGFAQVTAAYWIGWAELGRGLGETGDRRRRALEQAERRFARAALELALPRLASWSWLGLGIVRRELGESERAREALERLVERLPEDAPETQRAAALYELAVLELEEGRIERAREILDRAPPDALRAEQRRALQRLEAEAWLSRSPQDAKAAERAARLLRELAGAEGPERERAIRLALEHRERLRGFDLGPVSDLLEAEAAFEAGRYDEARAGYARLLAAERPLPGVDLDVVRYKHAEAVARTDAPAARALAELEPVLDHAELREPAARLAFTLALREDGASEAVSSRLRRAAKRVLEAAPDSPEADRARVVLARAGQGASARAERLALLDAVEEESDAYPAAVLERVRLRADVLQGVAPERVSPEVRNTARALRSDLEVLDRLTREGRLPPDPERVRRLAILRAQAAFFAGEAPGAVQELLAAARAHPGGLARTERQALLALELETLRRTGELGDLAQRFDRASEAELRRDWETWYAALARLSETPAGGEGSFDGLASAPLDGLVRGAERLAALAPERYRVSAALTLVGLLRAADDPVAAADVARRLLEKDPDSGDAWLAYARAVEAAGQDAEAAAAWSEVAAGVEPGGDLWAEAKLRAAAAFRRTGDLEAACRLLEKMQESSLTNETWRKQLREERRPCPP